MYINPQQRPSRVAGIVIATSEEQLPASCTTIIRVGEDSAATLEQPEDLTHRLRVGIGQPVLGHPRHGVHLGQQVGVRRVVGQHLGQIRNAGAGGVTVATEFDQGGHFPAMEVPDVLVTDIRHFFRPLRLSAAGAPRATALPAGQPVTQVTQVT